MTLSRGRIWLVAGAALLIALAIFATVRPSKKADIAPVQGGPAFLGTRWGQSPEEVEGVMGLKLKPAQERRFYEVRPGYEDRYRSYDADIRFLDRPASVNYVFLDGKLFIYHVFIEDRDGEGLDLDVREWLARTYGDDSVVVTDPGTLKLIWNKADLTVNYWYSLRELSLAGKYQAVFGAVYKPLEPPLSK